MPILDTNPIDPVEQLYKKYPNGAPDYATLSTELGAINRALDNPEGNNYIDSSYTSYRVGIIEKLKNSDVSKTLQKTKYWGIVLYVASGERTQIYIDVPGKSNPILDPDIFYTKADLDLKLYRQYLFSPQALDFLSKPEIGGIAQVELPQNYPAHINTNPQDAIYLGMKKSTKMIKINDTAKKADNVNGNGLQADNSAESSAGPNNINDPRERIDLSKNRQSVLGWFRGQPSDIEIELIGGYTQNPLYGEVNMATAARRMMAAYYSYRDNYPDRNYIRSLHGRVRDPYISDGYRSSKDQQDMIIKFGIGQAAPLHFSNHQSGLAIDFIGTYPGENVKGPKGVWTEGVGFFYDWLKVNAPKYGFKRTVETEHWHWEYRNQWVGTSGYKGNPREANQAQMVT